MNKDNISANHIVYWIYNTKNHANPLTEGYVGVTKQPLKSRLNTHINRLDTARDNVDGVYKVTKFLVNENLEDIAIKPITRKISQELAYKIEELMRPSKDIGWNGYKGGSAPSVQKTIIVTSPDGIDKEYSSIAGAARDGHHRGNLQHNLKGRNKTFDRGYTARYK